jgi:hypothetical protein
MPLTFPAHQALVLPVKLRWPSCTDGTAMCVGAAAPDLLYPVPGIGSNGHGAVGVVLLVVPLTVGICSLLRWRSALGVFGNLPDLGPFRLQSYRVITHRRPTMLATLVSALIGAVSHVLIDAFSHTGRWGSTLLGLDETLFSVPIRGEMSGARVIQYFGHTIGSAVAIGLFLYIGRSRRLDQWYGAAVVASARRFTMPASARVTFWVTFIAVAVAVTVALRLAGASLVFCAIDGLVAGALCAGAIPVTVGRSISAVPAGPP